MNEINNEWRGPLNNLASAGDHGQYEDQMPGQGYEATEGQNEGKRQLLGYLIGVAQSTQGAEVWRALFAEMLQRLEK